jgi:hypothetical protein
MVRFIKSYSGNQIKEDVMDEACNSIGQMVNANKILVGKPEGKKQLGRRRSRWKDNIRINLEKIGWEVLDWIYLAQVRDQ